jgi:hypothetical protein
LPIVPGGRQGRPGRRALIVGQVAHRLNRVNRWRRATRLLNGQHCAKLRSAPRDPGSPAYTDRDGHARCRDGWICEQHPRSPWPHGSCAGPGMQCDNADCPWWADPPQALRLNESFVGNADGRGAYRVAQPYGRDPARESTTLSEHPTVADAFAEIDRLAGQMARTGAPSDAITLVVLDGAGCVVSRPRLH